MDMFSMASEPTTKNGANMPRRWIRRALGGACTVVACVAGYVLSTLGGRDCGLWCIFSRRDHEMGPILEGSNKYKGMSILRDE